MTFGENEGQPALGGLTQQDASALVAKAFEAGVNLFDTADAYALGDSERFLGEALRTLGVPREGYLIAAKAYVEPEDMLAELREDSKALAARLREAHGVCEEHEDISTAGLIEVWIDETERRTWFLFEAGAPKRFHRTLKTHWIEACKQWGYA
jgi:aryl-alcohol dehydrogenase-like predicted oxidoreductase